jgi:hypothetical protein
MGQLLHGSARTTAALRRAIQQSQESIAKLAERYHHQTCTERPGGEDHDRGPGMKRLVNLSDRAQEHNL